MLYISIKKELDDLTWAEEWLPIQPKFQKTQAEF